jgi:hypothetical protein
MHLQRQFLPGDTTWTSSLIEACGAAAAVLVALWAAFQVFSNLKQTLDDLRQGQADMQRALVRVDRKLGQLLQSQTHERLDRLETAMIGASAAQQKAQESVQTPPPELT